VFKQNEILTIPVTACKLKGALRQQHIELRMNENNRSVWCDDGLVFLKAAANITGNGPLCQSEQR